MPLSDEFLNSLPIGIMQFDAEGQMVYANDEAAAILGAERDALYERWNIPANRSLLISENGEVVKEAPLLTTLRENRVVRQVLGVVRDGETTWIRAITAPLKDVAGSPIGGVGIVLDDHERIQARKDLEALRELHTLAAVAFAHEARTPLSKAKGFTELILMGMYGRISKATRTILTQTVLPGMDEIERIIRYCLVIWMNTEEPAAEFTQVDPGNILSRVCREMAELIKKKYRHTFTIHIQRGVRLWGHADMLAWMFNNLITNAAKFTPEGGRITVSSAVQEGYYVVAVEDNGPGIPEADQERIFEPFVQLSTGDRRIHSGWGVGLTAVRTFATLHDGRVTVSSVAGKGSTFQVFLPLTKGTP